MRLQDRKNTEVKLSAVTSAYADNQVNVTQGQGSSYPSIELTIGSCYLTLVYDNKSVRDSDLVTIISGMNAPAT